MKTKIHKILWQARWNRTKSDIHIEITDVDCMVKKVNHPCARWAVGEYWYIVCKWFQKKGAQITLGEERLIADEFPRCEKNPRRLSEQERFERLIYIKS